jgi:hypothetical protein
VHLGERGESHDGEQFVDDAMIAQMQNAILSYPSVGRTIVLLTGDGNDNGGRASFLSTVDCALRHNWRVEVTSWMSNNCLPIRTAAVRH